jgi:formamidopyrimidine-DNA glycosylase
VPELPEVEITARRLSRAVAGARVESALAPGLVALKTFDPPLDALAGRELDGVRRIGKMLAVEAGDLTLLVHLMSAGRLQLFDSRASLRDRASRILVRLEDGRELRLREFGTQQRAWAKLLSSDAVAQDEAVATLGPDAYPPPPVDELAELLDQPRHLHPLLRDQRTIAGIGRSWVDEILWTARLSPFAKGADLSDDELQRLAAACDERLGGALEHYERTLGDSVPDKMPMPLAVHRHAGEPCPRCGTVIEAVHYKDYVMCYCPQEQTGGRVYKDRRLSRLLK